MITYERIDYRSQVAADRCVSLLLAGVSAIEIAGQDCDLVVHVVAAPKIARDFFGAEIGNELDAIVRAAVMGRRLRWREGDTVGQAVLKLADVPTNVELDVHLTAESLIPAAVARLRAGW